MGWRDINMSRRKPPMRLAVIPMEEGEDQRFAVLRKAARKAFATSTGTSAIAPGLMPFAAGYLAGFARHQALKHGVDAEKDEGLMHALLGALTAEAPPSLAQAVDYLRFSPRSGARQSPRAALRAQQGLADAGYLAGHLASLCGSETLLRLSLAQLSKGDVEAFLTACDFAADRMQTHQPTMALRFDVQERAILREALS
jgi:hypothetical protein